MADRAAINDSEMAARRKAVALATEMLAGRLTFFEGAVQIAPLRFAVGGLAEGDPDFDAFVAIESETDHLPLQAQRPLWSASALERLAPEIAHTEKWAADFAPQACRSIIARFGSHDS